MSDALVFDQVVKRYRSWWGGGGNLALDGMSFRIPRGSICAFAGPNGAGKTTAFSVISGFLTPDGGEVDILGEGPFDPWRMKGRLGVLPQDAALSDRHTPQELLAHLARLGGLNGTEVGAEVERVLALVRLTDRTNDRIGSLSHGMRRRVAVASALVGRPELVLLDEPTAGLDPVEAHALREGLAGQRGDQTLVISSHNLGELERLCDHVIVLSNGRCVRQGPMAEITDQLRRVEWHLGPGDVPLAVLEARLPDHRWSLEERRLVDHLPKDADPDHAARVVMEALVGAGIAVREVRRGASLERRFIDETAPTRRQPARGSAEPLGPG